MKLFTKMLGFLLVLLFSLPALSAVAIIVHPDNDSQLDQAEVRRIFLGKARAFPDGIEAVPLDQNAGSALRSEFAAKVLKKNEGNLNSYWARMLFSSKAAPPKVAGNSEDVIRLVANNPRFIGYVDPATIDGSVRLLLLIP